MKLGKINFNNVCYLTDYIQLWVRCLTFFLCVKSLKSVRILHLKHISMYTCHISRAQQGHCTGQCRSMCFILLPKVLSSQSPSMWTNKIHPCYISDYQLSFGNRGILWLLVVVKASSECDKMLSPALTSSRA